MATKNLDIYFDAGIQLYNTGDLEGAIKCYYAALTLNMDDQTRAGFLSNLGNAFSALARIKRDEPLFLKSFEKYSEAIQLNPEDPLKAGVLFNWGTAICRLANIKKELSKDNQDMSLSRLSSELFRQSFEKFSESIRLRPDDKDVLYNWGIAIYDLTKIHSIGESYLESNTAAYETASQKTECPNISMIKGVLYFLLKNEDKAKECFRASKKDILEIFAFLDKDDQELIIQTEILYLLLDSDTSAYLTFVSSVSIVFEIGLAFLFCKQVL